MNDFITALGLVLVIEGLIYSIVPQYVKRMMMAVANEVPAETLRFGGLAAAAVGLGIVWLARSAFGAS